MKKRASIIMLILLFAICFTNQMEQQIEVSATEQFAATADDVSHDIAPIVTGGLMPKADRSYTYSPSFEGSHSVTYYAQKNLALEESIELLEEDFVGFTYIERNERLELGVAYSDVFYFSLSYPMVENETIFDTIGENPTTVTVTNSNATIATDAGIFYDVVVLTYPNGSSLYLAKDYGIIRITDPNGNITTELVAVH